MINQNRIDAMSAVGELDKPVAAMPRIVHPEPHTCYWSDKELEVIYAYAKAYAAQPALGQPIKAVQITIDALRRAAKEIIDGHFSGWGNTCEDAATLLENLFATPQPAQLIGGEVTDAENEQFSLDVSTFEGSDPEATQYALEQFLSNRATTSTKPAQTLQDAKDAATPPPVAGGEGLKVFTEYFAKNYPGPGTIIHDPYWHAPKIFRAAMHAFSLSKQEGV